jgi:hypothetical protein
MYDAPKVIAGIILFLALIFFPVWYNGVTGKAGYVPQLNTGTDEKKCIEETAFMKVNHMNLLNAWKDTAVRTGVRTYTARDGKSYTMSLTGTCMKCHSKKAEFCDRCHNYAGVKPYCWDCHNYEKVAVR